MNNERITHIEFIMYCYALFDKEAGHNSNRDQFPPTFKEHLNNASDEELELIYNLFTVGRKALTKLDEIGKYF